MQDFVISSPWDVAHGKPTIVGGACSHPPGVVKRWAIPWVLAALKFPGFSCEVSQFPSAKQNVARFDPSF